MMKYGIECAREYPGRTKNAAENLMNASGGGGGQKWRDTKDIFACVRISGNATLFSEEN